MTKKQENIAKKGDLIAWYYRGQLFVAKVALVDYVEKHYGVYCDYGQDLIPFDKAILVDEKRLENILSGILHFLVVAVCFWLFLMFMFG